MTFASDRDGTVSLYWKRADGRGVAERLTTADEGTSHWPSSWSPDGQVLAYMVQTGARQGDWDVWTLSIDGNAAESLYDVPDTAHMGPVFSPDGTVDGVWVWGCAGVAGHLRRAVPANGSETKDLPGWWAFSDVVTSGYGALLPPVGIKGRHDGCLAQSGRYRDGT